MKIIYLTPFAPVSDSHGCGWKTRDDIEHLSRHHDISLVCFSTPSDTRKLQSLSSVSCRIFPFTVERYDRIPSRCPALTERLRSLCGEGRCDILQCECSFMTRFIPRQLPAPSLMTEHQVYWLHFLREFSVTGNPVTLLRSVKNIFDEIRWTGRFDRVVFLSDHDRRCFDLLLQDKQKADVVPLGIDTDFFSPLEGQDCCWDACFLGNFSSFPNLDAVRYFVRNILPLIQKEIPTFSFLIFGQDPDNRLQAFRDHPGVTIEGAVDDVRPYLARSRVFVNPMRLGSGMRRKVLEAWSLARPVVSTSIGSEGVMVNDGKNIVLADTPGGFADAVAALVRDQARQSSLGIEARRTVERSYDKRRVADRLECLYARLAQKQTT